LHIKLPRRLFSRDTLCQALLRLQHANDTVTYNDTKYIAIATFSTVAQRECSDVIGYAGLLLLCSDPVRKFALILCESWL